MKIRRIRSKFTQEEDDKLRELIKKHGDRSWSIVSSFMENRSQRQCRERWKHYLSSDLPATAPWTKEEDAILIKKFNELGAKWTKIARELPGRTDIQVKTRYIKFLKDKVDNPGKIHDTKLRKSGASDEEDYSKTSKINSSKNSSESLSKGEVKDKSTYSAKITLTGLNEWGNSHNGILDYVFELDCSNFPSEIFENFDEDEETNKEIDIFCQGLEPGDFTWTFE
ncbi:hypothetical protein TRFO_02247 [Tritrichomonas foetus]|uniref:Myb-like DNA-binding domain containing protein n=1 Tax=Tritrichomonas foetus TaxID=1144522 RepID=A0A1J4JDA8_9EUKA|nr:hypothetical protein TRFO_02247 [Tritrichomonas foetus]|eukprot:OHS95260.1 hypothetical protein TRFO_02247 [Tritrichomonas foetus]